MAEQSLPEAPWWCDAQFAMDWMLAASRMCRATLTSYTLWWSAGINTFCPHVAQPRGAIHDQGHDQLVVPEPLELAGERGLFA